MTSHSGTVEDERLREIIQEMTAAASYCSRHEWHPSHAMGYADIASALTELIARRSAAPSRPVEAGELVPVAWRILDDDANPSHNSTTQANVADHWQKAGFNVEALVPASSLTSLQARVEELESVLRELAAWRTKPWTDMADGDETQLRDVRHALDTACHRARSTLKGEA